MCFVNLNKFYEHCEIGNANDSLDFPHENHSSKFQKESLGNFETRIHRTQELCAATHNSFICTGLWALIGRAVSSVEAKWSEFP